MEQVIFSIILLSAIYLFILGVKKIWGAIQLGKDFDQVDQKSERWKQVLLIAFGQKKMFKKPIVAVLHLMVYIGFLIVNLELLEIIIDGVFGSHRFFQPFLGNAYPMLINIFELFAVLVILSCVVFFIRRNILAIKRFKSKEMTDWPTLDGNLILIFEVVLMFFLLSMNATDSLIQNANSQEQSFLFSDFLFPLYEGFSPNQLHIAERFFWWIHICGIFFFANYVLKSKHLHIFLAFPNTYFANLESKGKIKNMPSVTNEVKLMLGLPAENTTATTTPESFGAKDITDLNKKNILNAFSCTECGRCTESCPANMTGKLLSPRKIMMDVRDRAEEIQKNQKPVKNEQSDGKSLLGDFITEEEIYACTSCNACTEACPINIDPLDIILQLRRYKAMEEAQGPQEWIGMYQNIETSFSPWKFPPNERFNWASDINNKSI